MTTPASRLPSAQSASSTPDSALLPVLVGERDGGDLGAAEQHAQRDAHDRRAARASATASAAGPAGGPVARVGRRLGAALGGERQAAAHAGDHRGGQPGERVTSGREHGDQGRAEDEDRLVDDRLEREGGLHLGCRSRT